MWMLRGWRTQGRGHGSVDGVEVEGAGKRDEVGDTGTESLWSLCGGLLGVAVGHGASIGRRQEMK